MNSKAIPGHILDIVAQEKSVSQMMPPGRFPESAETQAIQILERDPSVPSNVNLTIKRIMETAATHNKDAMNHVIYFLKEYGAWKNGKIYTLPHDSQTMLEMLQCRTLLTTGSFPGCIYDIYKANQNEYINISDIDIFLRYLWRTICDYKGINYSHTIICNSEYLDGYVMSLSLSGIDPVKGIIKYYNRSDNTIKQLMLK